MIITRTPFRITLGGGGTDLPAYYSRYGGFVFAAAINKYMVININRPVVDDLIRLKYSQSEIVDRLDHLQHDLAREALRLTGIDRGIEIVSMADVPEGTGLGSSSCYAVGLLYALHTLKRDHISLQDLAEQACYLEIDLLHRPIGKQDQYIAAFGGFSILEIAQDGRVRVTKADIPDGTLDELQRNLLIFYTGTSRHSVEILSEQSRAAQDERGRVVNHLHAIKEIGYQMQKAILEGNLTDVGLLFDRHWTLKKQLSAKVSNPKLDELYAIAKSHGALGGKVLGAGGGGFFIFYVESNHAGFRAAMKQVELREMRYRFDFEGTKVMANFLDGSH